MIFPYMRQRLRRTPLSALPPFLLCLAAALLLCMLRSGCVRLQTQLDAVYENSTVTCQVSNLTGTQTEALQLPEWVARIFMGKESIPEREKITYSDEANATEFASWFREVYAETTLRVSSSCGDIRLVGVTDRRADHALMEEYGGGIHWLYGHDNSFFASGDDFCIVSASLYERMLAEECTSLTVYGVSEQHPVEVPFAVIGTHAGADNLVYTSWGAAAQLQVQLEGVLTTDSITAVLRDNRTISQFRKDIMGLYFAAPNAQGQKTTWTGSIIHSSYPYALLINDATLQKTVSQLERNLTIYQLCTYATVLLTCVLGLTIGHLIVRHRSKALALQRVLGQSNCAIFFEAWAELSGASLLGAAVGLLAAAMLGARAVPWGTLLLALLSCVLGIASAIVLILRTDLVRSIKEGN